MFGGGGGKSNPPVGPAGKEGIEGSGATFPGPPIGGGPIVCCPDGGTWLDKGTTLLGPGLIPGLIAVGAVVAVCFCINSSNLSDIAIIPLAIVSFWPTTSSILALSFLIDK